MVRKLLICLASLSLTCPAIASTQQPSNTTYRLISAANSDNATLISGYPIYVGTIIGYNASASARWVKLYDKATAPTSADTPRKSYYIPASTAFAFDVNDYYILGCGYRLVTGSADGDNTAVTAGDILGLTVDYRR